MSKISQTYFIGIKCDTAAVVEIHIHSLERIELGCWFEPETLLQVSKRSSRAGNFDANRGMLHDCKWPLLKRFAII